MADWYRSAMKENPAPATLAFLVVSVLKCVVFWYTETRLFVNQRGEESSHMFSFMGSPVSGSVYILGCDFGNVETCGSVWLVAVGTLLSDR